MWTAGSVQAFRGRFAVCALLHLWLLVPLDGREHAEDPRRHAHPRRGSARRSPERACPISAADVMAYDSQGQLEWASDGMRAWVGSLSLGPSTAARPGSGEASFAQTPQDHRKVSRKTLYLVAGGLAVAVVLLVLAVSGVFRTKDQPAGSPSQSAAGQQSNAAPASQAASWPTRLAGTLNTPGASPTVRRSSGGWRTGDYPSTRQDGDHQARHCTRSISSCSCFRPFKPAARIRIPLGAPPFFPGRPPVLSVRWRVGARRVSGGLTPFYALQPVLVTVRGSPLCVPAFMRT